MARRGVRAREARPAKRGQALRSERLGAAEQK
jgi:hypothetical protein